MSYDVIGFILDAVGKVLVAYTAIRVHYRVRKEHSIDEKVFTAMRREHVLGIIGISLIVIGVLLQLGDKVGY